MNNFKAGLAGSLLTVFVASGAYAQNEQTPSFSPEEQATISLFDDFWKCLADTEIQNDKNEIEWHDKRRELNDKLNAQPPILTQEEFDHLREQLDSSRPDINAEEHCTEQLDIDNMQGFQNDLNDVVNEHGSEVLENIALKHMQRMMFPSP